MIWLLLLFKYLKRTRSHQHHCQVCTIHNLANLCLVRCTNYTQTCFMSVHRNLFTVILPCYLQISIILLSCVSLFCSRRTAVVYSFYQLTAEPCSPSHTSVQYIQSHHFITAIIPSHQSYFLFLHLLQCRWRFWHLVYNRGCPQSDTG